MAFLANATARFTHCVSPAGSSAGPGGRATPWQTVDQARAACPSTATAVGGALPEVRLLGSATSPNTFVSTAGLTVSGKLTIVADEDKGAKLAGNGTSEAILMANGGDLTLRGVRLDPSLNNGGAAAVGITIPSTVPAVSVTLDSVQFENWTDHAIKAPGTNRVNYTQTDCIGIGDQVAGFGFIANHAGGAIVVNGGSCQIARANTAQRGGLVIIGGAGAGGSVAIADFDTSVTVDPTLTDSAVHYGIRIFDMPGASIVDGGHHESYAAAGSRTVQNVRIEFNVNDISGSQIKNATFYNSTNGGIGFGIGTDGYVASGGTGCGLYNVSGSAGAAARAGGIHGFFLGCLTNGVFSDITGTDLGLALVDKTTTGTTFAGTIRLTGFSGSGIRSKDTTNATYSGFQLVQTAGYASGTMLDLSWDGGSGPNTTGLSFTGTFDNQGGTGTRFVVSAVGDTFTPANNVYNLTSGALAATPWIKGASTYPTKSAWQTVEPTATGTAP